MSLVTHLMNRLRGLPVETHLGAYEKTVRAIERVRPAITGLGDDGLRDRALALRARGRAGAPLDDLLPETFAVVGEAAARLLGMRPYHVQELAGVVLHRGKVAELMTGEGKTLAAVAPAILHALGGEAVHVLTFNDYLARRDAEWMGPVYRLFDLEVTAIQEHQGPRERRVLYKADVVYATAREVGFDVLRDGRTADRSELVLRPFGYAVVDECDSLLVDEARVPLVLAGTDEALPVDPRRVASLVKRLERGRHFETDDFDRAVYLTDAGVDQVESLLGIEGLHSEEHRTVLTLVNLALHAEALLDQDVDYVVTDGRIEMVDEFTGRVAEGRRWPDGLHGALQAKEGLAIDREGVVLGTITVQHLGRLYPTLAGMTATAAPAAEELQEFYGLKVVVIPPHYPSIREDLPDLVFTHREAKERALVEEIARVHATGRPLLVGTGSVEESERVASLLAERRVPCRVLNAKNDEEEASIIKEAGDLGAVTISTNMAGRGTDIKLGGADGRHQGEVLALGGLLVLGTTRHESRRIDDQLRGRAGRQGDPGASRFYVCFEDELMARYELADLLPKQWRGRRQDEPIPDDRLGSKFGAVQTIIEGQHLTLRTTLYRYSHLVEAQRKHLVTMRRGLLQDDTGSRLLAEACPDRYREVVETFGAQSAVEAERLLTLYHLDDLWSDHLARIATIKEGIHLQSLAGSHDPFALGKSPVDVFHAEVAKAFLTLLERLDDRTVASFEEATITEDGVDLLAMGLSTPASTWTYLVTDTPFGLDLERVVKGVISLVKRKWGR